MYVIILQSVSVNAYIILYSQLLIKLFLDVLSYYVMGLCFMSFIEVCMELHNSYLLIKS